MGLTRIRENDMQISQFFVNGDMNGIALICPEWVARCFFGMMFFVNGLVFWKRVLPIYQQSFSGQ